MRPPLHDPEQPNDKRAEVTRAVAQAMAQVYGEEPVACAVVWQHDGGPTHLTSNLPSNLIISLLAEAIQRTALGPPSGVVNDPMASPAKPS